nr:TonB-dependent receptor [Sphingomonas astaxanthinifaciens]
MTIHYLRRALLGGTALLVANSGAAFAQTAPAQTGEAATADAPADDIVVTAQRRSERLQDVPISVTAVRGDALRDFQVGGEDILALSGRVPGLYAETTTGRIFPRFYVRGLGNIDFYLGASQPVSIVQDEVVMEHVVLKSNPVFDIGQVEVLRGPQGSLFGRNTTAGIVKFDTLRPTSSTQGRFNASYGSFNTVTFDGGLGGPIAGDVLTGRVSAFYQHRDDWVSNSYRGPSADGTVSPAKDVMGGFDDKAARLQLQLKPATGLSFLLSGHVRDYKGTSTLFRRAALVRGSNSVERVVRDEVAYDEARNNPQAYKMQGVSLRSSVDLGGISLTSITAYEHASGNSRGDTDGGAAADYPFNGLPNGYGQSEGRLRDLDQLSQEVRLADDSGPFKWQVGGIYFDSRDTTEFYQRAFFTGTNPNNWVRLRNVNTSWGVFGQLSYDLTDALSLTVGARQSTDRKHTRLLKASLNAAGVDTYTGRRDVRLKDNEPSWDVSALYKVNPDFSLYARVARGFRGPTIQGRSAVFNADFTTANSETNLSGEGGFKSNLFGRTLTLNGSLFAYRVRDIQLNGNDSNGNGVLFNADKATGYGAELEADWRATPTFRIGAGLSLLRTKIRDKRVFAQTCSLNGVQTCTVLDPFFIRGTGTGRTYFASIDGNPLPQAPKYNLDFNARYDVPMEGGRAYVSTDWNLQGKTSFVLYRTVEFTVSDNLEGGLKLGYESDRGYDVALFARNITNEKNLKGVIENYNAAVLNEPRVIGISLGARFR